MKNFIKLLSNKDNQKQIILFIFLNVFLVSAEIIAIGAIPLFIDVFVNPNPILPTYFKVFKNLAEIKDNTEIVFFSIIFFTFIFFIKNFLYVTIVYFQASLKKKFNFYLKKKLLKIYLHAPFENMKSYNSSEILRNTDTETQNYVTNFFNILKFSKDILLFFSIFVLLLIVDIYSTILVLLFLSLLVTLYIFTFYNYLNKVGLLKLKAVNAVYQWINQTCGAIKEIKIAKKEDTVLKYFSNKVLNHEDQKKKIEIISSLPIAFFEIVFVILILFMINFIISAETKNILPTLSLYIVAFIRLLPVVSRVGSTISSLRSFSPSVELLNAEINKFYKYLPIKKEQNFANEDKLSYEKNFQLKNLSFKYRNGHQNIFDNFNFQIKKGNSIAILGKSGSGKTTLINLICGFLKPTSGKILSDEIELDDKNIRSWQENIGLISQDNYLLDDTLKNNILFLNNSEKIDKKKFEEAVFYSGISEFLHKLGNGLDTQLGERGTILSSGQIQRVALARLLYRDPAIMILDEFTNSLDPSNEDLILENLKKLQNKKNKTFIVISHKLKPLKICNEIIILENGKISEKLNYSDFYNKYHLLFN